MSELTMEERGAYNSLIDVLYCRDGNVPDDDVLVARLIYCHWREWRALKKRLIAKGKVHILEGGKITANRVQDCLREAAEFSQKQSTIAKKRWKSTPPPMPAGNASTTTTTTTILPSFGKESERLTISADLINHERSKRPAPPPGEPATALVGSAPSPPASATPQPPSEASQKAATEKASKPSNGSNPERPFTPAEIGKPNGWDWEPPRKKLSKMSLDALLAEPDDNQEKVA